MRRADRRTAASRLLIHPPFADPTQPYLSLPTLKGHLRADSLDARVVDLNLEAAHYLMRPTTLSAFVALAGARFVELNRSASLSLDEQLEYRALAEARAGIDELLTAERSPIEVFRDPEQFYDAGSYQWASEQFARMFALVSATRYPYRFDFNRAGHPLLPWSFSALRAYYEAEQSPIEEFYAELFSAGDDADGDRTPPALAIDLAALEFVGISLVFPSQIPEAFYLAQWIRRRAPDAFIAFGGPCVHQAAVHMDEGRRRELLRFVDGVGLYEGEETLAELFQRLPELAGADAARRSALLSEVPNLLTWDAGADTSRTGPPRMVDLREARAPDYSDLDLDRYLSPSRILLYAPTRGCYWNQCSFCYYGLSENATAKYREVPPERAASDLAKLARRHATRNFYISCDVLSPSYALRFAEALLARGVDIRWTSDLKIDRYFTAERCQTLFRSGLRSAAFGIESGSDRILELMRKGCDRKTMTDVNRNFHAAGIATEWMTFTDHPGETTREALATIEWIAQEEDHVDLFIVGEFGLQPGSHIANEPARYHVRRIYYAEDDDLRLYALFEEEGGERDRADVARIEEALARVAAPYALNPYPWAGANSTHHSLLLFIRLGQRAFRHHFQRAKRRRHEDDIAPRSRRAPWRERERFSTFEIDRAEGEFLRAYLRRALHTEVAGRRREMLNTAPISAETYRSALASFPRLAPM